jgi:Flp pilus assembly protein TadB
VAVYVTLLLFGSVAMPLYVAYAVEQSARHRFCRRLAAAAAAAAAQGQVGWQQQLQQQQAGDATQQQQQQEVNNNNLGNHNNGQVFVADPVLDACSQGRIANSIARWAVHLLLLLSMLLLCWLLANAFALQLLPKMLNSQQLDLWCPNKPRLPFVMAGQVYTGGDF